MSLRTAVSETHVLDVPSFGRITAVVQRDPALALDFARIDIDVPIHPLPKWVWDFYREWVLQSWGMRILNWGVSCPLIVTRQRGKFCFQQKGSKISENEGDVL